MSRSQDVLCIAVPGDTGRKKQPCCQKTYRLFYTLPPWMILSALSRGGETSPETWSGGRGGAMAGTLTRGATEESQARVKSSADSESIPDAEKRRIGFR
jgi:hypothetical protein